MTIFAAGVVCWREERGKITFALVHRERYDDWGFAKGKQDPGEELCETAVREVEEELGLKIKLGRKISTIHYQVGSGEDKEVHYWASKVTDKTLKKNRFVPNEEISMVEWHEPKSALKLLSYPHDKALLKEVLELAQEKELETRALIVLRHAKATPRSDWSKGEKSRPLLPLGAQQAERLVSQLSSYGPKKLITSPWKRCKDTVVPYAKFSNRTLLERSQLSEYTAEQNPKKAKRLIEDIFEGSLSSLICTHRPALPKVLEAIAVHARVDLKPVIAEASTLDPGAFMVIRLSMDKKPKVVSIERSNAEAQVLVG
jgi:Phosphohistidine phosphatase SixA